MTDDQRADTLAGMTKVNTLLADKGVRFANGMVPTSLCCPSRSTILTGLYAHHTRVFGNGDVGGARFGGWAQFHRRGMEYRTIATALADRGYRTGFFGKYLNDFSRLSPDGYTPPGWDVFTAFKYSRGAYFGYRLTDGTLPRHQRARLLHRRARPAEQAVRPEHSRRPAAVPDVRAVRPAQPLHPRPARPRPGGGHAPVLAPAMVTTWASRLARSTRSRAGSAAVRLRRAMRRRPGAGRRPPCSRSTTRWPRWSAPCAARVVSGDTLFVFMSDNGYLWGEHGIVGKDNPYDGAARVPLVVRWDGHSRAGVVDDRLALNVDIAGTIAAATGASMRTDGLDLLAAPTRTGSRWRPWRATGTDRRTAAGGLPTHMYVRYATGPDRAVRLPDRPLRAAQPGRRPGGRRPADPDAGAGHEALQPAAARLRLVAGSQSGKRPRVTGGAAADSSYARRRPPHRPAHEGTPRTMHLRAARPSARRLGLVVPAILVLVALALGTPVEVAAAPAPSTRRRRLRSPRRRPSRTSCSSSPTTSGSTPCPACPT